MIECSLGDCVRTAFTYDGVRVWSSRRPLTEIYVEFDEWQKFIEEVKRGDHDY